MMEEQLKEKLKDTYLFLIGMYGGGHSVVRQYKAFMLNNQLSRIGRAVINEAKEEAMVAAKSSLTIAVKPSAPVPRQEPKAEAATLPNKSTAQTSNEKGDEKADVAGVDIIQDAIAMDIAGGISNTIIAAKYEPASIRKYAEAKGVVIDGEWNIKQIVAAIKKSLLPV